MMRKVVKLRRPMAAVTAAGFSTVTARPITLALVGLVDRGPYRK